MKYLKTYNETLRNVLKGKSDDEILSDIKNFSTTEIIAQSFVNNFKAGFKYILDNRKNELSNDEIYILEKYVLNLHQNEEKPYEMWFKEQLTNLESFPSKNKNYKNFIIYKKNDVPLFNYDLKNNDFYIDYVNVWSIFESKFKLNGIYIILLTKKLVEKHLNLNVKTALAPNLCYLAQVEEHLNLNIKNIM